ncbi:hypothetical protein PENTCL1PPCAC_5216, partial [Pristionchus entomophagus]
KNEQWDKKIVRATVRNGCIATFWSSNYYSRSSHADTFNVDDREHTILSNVEYGEYDMEALSTGTAAGGAEESGLGRVTCYCDPTRT